MLVTGEIQNYKEERFMIIVKLVEHNEAFFDAIDEDDDEVAEALK